MTFLFIGSLGMPELVMLLIIILVFFGAKKIPELAKGFGQGIKEFKAATKTDSEGLAKDEVDSLTKDK